MVQNCHAARQMLPHLGTGGGTPIGFGSGRRESLRREVSYREYLSQKGCSNCNVEGCAADCPLLHCRLCLLLATFTFASVAFQHAFHAPQQLLNSQVVCGYLICIELQSSFRQEASGQKKKRSMCTDGAGCCPRRSGWIPHACTKRFKRKATCQNGLPLRQKPTYEIQMFQ